MGAAGRVEHEFGGDVGHLPLPWVDVSAGGRNPGGESDPRERRTDSSRVDQDAGPASAGADVLGLMRCGKIWEQPPRARGPATACRAFRSSNRNHPRVRGG